MCFDFERNQCLTFTSLPWCMYPNRSRVMFPRISTGQGLQVSFALGAVKTGIPGGLLGGALFQLPGLVIMSLVGVGAASFLKGGHVWAQATTDGAARIMRCVNHALCKTEPCGPCYVDHATTTSACSMWLSLSACHA